MMKKHPCHVGLIEMEKRNELDFGTLKIPLKKIDPNDEFDDYWNKLKDIISIETRNWIRHYALTLLNRKIRKMEKRKKDPIMDKFDDYKKQCGFSNHKKEVMKLLFFIEQINSLRNYYQYLKEEGLRYEFILSLFCDIDYYDVKNVFQSDIITYLRMEGDTYYKEFTGDLFLMTGIKDMMAGKN